MRKIALVAPTLLRVNPATPAGIPLAGAELSLTHLRVALEQLGHTAICFTNIGDLEATSAVRSFADFDESDFDIAVYSRTYGHLFPSKHAKARRILWLHDTVEEAASLIEGGTAALGKALKQYDRLVFVSAWHRLQFVARFGNKAPLGADAISIQHLVPEVPIVRSSPALYDVIHTAHPRKALSRVLDIFDALHERRPELRLALVDAADIYQDLRFQYEGQETTLREVLVSRYGRAPAPFDILPPMPQAELMKLLTRVHVLLHPDQSVETGATTVLEAILAGCTAVVSDLGCLPEITCLAGQILPDPRNTSTALYADTVAALVDQENVEPIDARITARNAVLLARWSRVLSDVHVSANDEVDPTGLGYVDFNATLADWRERIDFRLGVGQSQLSNRYKVGIHILPDRGLAVLGLLEPVLLPNIASDVDKLASCYLARLGRLISELEERGISRLVMRIACHSNSYPVLSALLCAASQHGAKVTTVRSLHAKFQEGEGAEEFERQHFSRRTKEQVSAAHAMWMVKPICLNEDNFEQWISLYKRHLQRHKAVGMKRSEIVRLLNQDGPLSLFGAVAIDAVTGQPGGFYAVLCMGTFAYLHSWGTEGRFASNLHKLLIAHSIHLSRAKGVVDYEYGSDLSEYGLNPGLNSLYRRFGGSEGKSLQIDLPIQSARVWEVPSYAAT